MEGPGGGAFGEALSAGGEFWRQREENKTRRELAFMIICGPHSVLGGQETGGDRG